MNILCVIGWHKWKNVIRMLAKPERRVADITLPGHLWQHPSTWPVISIPYTKTYDVLGKRCSRCGSRK